MNSNKPALSMRLLAELSRRAESEPVWALFVANEYLDRQDPLRHALVAMTFRGPRREDNDGLLSLARAGATLADLSVSDQAKYRGLTAGPGRPARQVTPSDPALARHLHGHRAMRLELTATRTAHPIMRISGRRGTLRPALAVRGVRR